MYRVIAAGSLLISPLAPAIVFGGRAHQWIATELGAGWLAVAGGISAAIALESIGALAGHTAVTFWRRGDRRWSLAAVALAVYALAGAIEAGGGIGSLLFVLLLVLYPVVALHHDAESADAIDRASADIDAERRHALTVLRAEQRHAERMAAASSQLAAVSSQLAASQQQPAASYQCAGCGAMFSSPQQLGGHRRHCAGNS